MSFILDHPIGRRHPVRCLGRFAGWQLRSRLLRGPHRVPFVGDTSLYGSKGEPAVSVAQYVGLCDFAEMCFVAHLLKKGDLFVDVGANCGSYSILASGWCGANVISVEPAPETFARLKRNVSLNSLEQFVECVECALGATKGVVRFSKGLDSLNHVIEGESDFGVASINVELNLLDNLCLGREPCIIKIDVEGSEHDVLLGAGRVLASQNLKVVIIEDLKRNKLKSEAIFDIFHRAGFDPCLYDPWTRTLDTFRLGHGNNIVYVRDIRWINSRLREAKPVELFGEQI